MKSNKTNYFRLILLLVIIITAILVYFNGGSEYLTLNYLKSQLADFQRLFNEEPLRVTLSFFGIYVLATAISLPGATILTLLAGAIFGTWLGLIISSFASTLGALISFLASRFLLRSLLLQKFQRQFKTIDENIKKDGAIYLATLRLVPIFPFFVINLVMGLTAIKVWTYIWVSQLAMIPGTAVYVYAGREFSQLESLKGIMSPNIIIAFTLLGLLPLIGKFIASFIKSRKVYKGHKKPASYDYNLITIGAGSAGLVTSYIGATLKSKVALIEKDRMGGDCLNTGCVPSKALIKTAKVVHLKNRSVDFGLKEIKMDFNFSDVMERVQRVITEIEPHDSIERYEKLGVHCIKGEAKILSPWSIRIGNKTVTSKNIVIATGAGPALPKIPGLDTANYVTSNTIWSIRELPKKFLIMGGGPIGCELAQAFCRLGSDVTIIEGTERLLSKEDIEVAGLINQTFTDEGIKILTSHTVQAFKNENGVKKVICNTHGKQIELEYDLILVAVGRKPQTKGFGLEELGVRLRDNGTIDVNEYQQSNFPNIYACGDVAGPYQLTHMAAHQAWYCAVNSLFPIRFKVDYRVVPWCTYTDPEIATVGETESSAKEKGLEYEVTQYELSDLDRAIAEDEKKGFVRVITQKGKDKILGATIVSSQASNMILEYVSAMKNKKGLNSILGTIHVYPSFGEANKYAAGNWKRDHVHPKVMPLLEKYFNLIRK
jgi:dihydrolipoamide dehydrogenase